MPPLEQFSLSIVVASHRPGFIGRCLDALIASCQESAERGCEIIVVTDFTAEAFITQYPTIAWEYCADKSISRKRNCGIRKAKGKIVGFVDDDCMVKSGWIKTALQFFNDHGEDVGVEGRTTIEKVEKGASHLREFKRLEKRGFRTNNIFYTKAALESAGGFDERFSVQREDLDLAFTILQAGKQIGYCESLEVIHCFRPHEPWDLLKNCWNRRFDPLLFKKHPEQYRQTIKHPVPPGIAFVGAFWLLFLVIILFFNKLTVWYSLISLLTIGALALRRNQWRFSAGFAFIRDSIAFLLSPLVLWSALVYGSIKWKKILLW